MSPIDPLQAFLILVLAAIVFVALMIFTLVMAFRGNDAPRRRVHRYHLPWRHA